MAITITPEMAAMTQAKKTANRAAAASANANQNVVRQQASAVQRVSQKGLTASMVDALRNVRQDNADFRERIMDKRIGD